MPIFATFFIQTCLTTKFSKFFVQILLEIKRGDVHSISGAKIHFFQLGGQWKQARLEKRDASPPLQLLAHLAFTKTTLRP